ncbi:DUF3429 domain-containing protein [Pelagibacterales bacterium]|nr:DUF3429 domain-containing protein [Pelagibacterales bacterium]
MGQRSFLILGTLGLIPFVVIFAAYFISPPEEKVYEFLTYLFVAYAAIIASFLGGIQWGMIISRADLLFNIGFPLTMSVVPALLAWSALLVLHSLTFSLILIIVSFLFATATDFYLYNKKATPYWFLNTRVPLSVLVVVLTFILLLQ